MATNGGVFRSTDGGRNFVLIYYSTFPAELDVRTIQIDPFDPETAYIGTMRGAYVTHNLRTAIIGPDGVVKKIYTGNEWTPDDILTDLKPVANAD